MSIRVKIINNTIPSPNSISCDPSPSNTIYEFNRIVERGQKIFIPFNWSIINYEIVNEKPIILELLLNNNTLNNLSINGERFRIIFELWVFNEDSNDFEFAWINEDLSNQCAWNQIWFNLSQTTQ